MIKKILLIGLLAVISMSACEQKSSTKKSAKTDEDTSVKNEKVNYEVTKSEAEWKAELNDQEYYVLRKAGTERAFKGDLWDHKEDGIYICRACQLPLFDSSTKFKSGTGWPSYYQPLNEECIASDTDYVLGYARTEVHCSRCGGHMGHVFKDGPEPTGLRYCINSVSLDFITRADYNKEP